MAESGAHAFGPRFGKAVFKGAAWAGRLARGQVVELVGGPARARVILLFAGVLALSGADASTVGSVAPQLEHSLHIGNAKVGLLTSVSLLVGAVFVLPVGVLVDRFRRIPLLAVSIVLWSVASLAGAFAGSYWHLLLDRLALGAVTATAGPAIASLTGDYFAARERTRIYAFILGGEAAGTAAGFIVSGSLAGLISWRAAFVVLAIPGFFLARTLWRTVPEPRRGGQSWLAPGVEDLEAVQGTPSVQEAEAPAMSPVGEGDAIDAADPARAMAQERGVSPDPELILREDPQQIGIRRAVRYMLMIPTNALLIIGSALGYFFFSGLQTFALLFVRGHYHVGQAESELGLAILVGGALIGTLSSGQLTDFLLRRGMLSARVSVPAFCYAGAAVMLIPGILGAHMFPAVWFDAGGAALVSAANPPLDAARLDIMPPGLWGRAESIRTFLRSIAQAFAPLLFGGLSQVIAGIVPAQAPIGTHPGLVSSSAAKGLEFTFLIMLVSLGAASVFLFRARHTYATDVATAAASRQAAPPSAASLQATPASAEPG